MKIQNIQSFKYTPTNTDKTYTSQPNISASGSGITHSIYNVKGGNIYFGDFIDPNRTVPNIDYEEYKAMSEPTKRRFRKLYNLFDEKVDTSQMFDSDVRLPLKSEEDMDAFIKAASIYKNYKDCPIICLGRSPKWFLNAALWMKDGINDYKFVAFSGYWFIPDRIDGIRKISKIEPTPEEIKSYRKYLSDIQADPISIIKKSKETGKRTVITDYIYSGKGMSSFLEVLFDYADDLGVAEEFSKSIQIVAIGSTEYIEEMTMQDEVSAPEVILPPKYMDKYFKNIPQKFYDIENLNMFKSMLIQGNTNECRSTYYPHNMWPIYRPDKFKTGAIKGGIKDIEAIKEEYKGRRRGGISHYTPEMFDYRNLLNFRILDSLNRRGLLKENHRSKV